MRKIIVNFSDGTSKRYVSEELAEKAIEKACNGELEIIDTDAVKVEFGKGNQDWVLLIEEGEVKFKLHFANSEEARLTFEKYVSLGYTPKGGTAEVALTASKEEIIAMAESFSPGRKTQTDYNRTWSKKNKAYDRYLKDRSSARSFIRNKATLEDLDEILKLIEERRKKLKEEQ